MLTINWQQLGADSKQDDTETIYEISTISVRSRDDNGNPTRIEMITIGMGSMLVTSHISHHQRIYVMNDIGKTIATYEVPSKPAANGN